MRIDGRIEQQEERHRAQEYTHRRTRADQGNGSKLKHLNGSKLEPDTMSQYTMSHYMLPYISIVTHYKMI